MNHCINQSQSYVKLCKDEWMFNKYRSWSWVLANQHMRPLANLEDLARFDTEITYFSYILEKDMTIFEKTEQTYVDYITAIRVIWKITMDMDSEHKNWSQCKFDYN